MIYDKEVNKIEDHVNLFYQEHTDARFFFHNYFHAGEVVKAASKIADHYELDDHIRFIISAAAWFCLEGFLITGTASPEEKSAELAQEYLMGAGISDEDITAIKKCITSTKIPQAPGTLPEKIVCDAILFYLGTDEFSKKNKLLKREIESLENREIEGNEWRADTIKMLETHTYHTNYCRLILDKNKAEHLEKLKRKQQGKLPENPIAVTSEIDSKKAKANTDDAIKIEKDGPPKKSKLPTRGIGILFRISSSNSVRISEMADSKSRIMISVNSIVMSVVLGLIVKNLDQTRYLIIPTIILLTVNVTTIIYSVLATRPKITAGVFTKEQVANKSVDLFFFGNFYKMSFEDYDFGMREMMNHTDFLYASMIKDIYSQGKVLGRKYTLLHKSYNIFMYGLVASLLAYAIAVLIKIWM